MTLHNPTYLIVGVKGVTRLDLFDAIETTRPHASIIYAKTLPEALPMMTNLGSLDASVIYGSAAQLLDSGMLDVLQRLGGIIVLMGDAAEDDARSCPYSVLRRPFGADDILSALEIVHHSTQ